MPESALSFEASLLRTFGPREAFRSALLHALRRCQGGYVYLTLMPDDSLRLYGLQGSAPCPGAPLLTLTAPAADVSEELLALRIDVIDWRSCAHRYDMLLSGRSRLHRP